MTSEMNILLTDSYLLFSIHFFLDFPDNRFKNNSVGNMDFTEYFLVQESNQFILPFASKALVAAVLLHHKAWWMPFVILVVCC